MEEKVNKYPPTFEWTDERVAEVSKVVAIEYSNSEIWSGDNTVELNIIRRYKLDYVLRQKMEKLNITSLGNEDIVAVNKKELEKLIAYLCNYQAELQSI